MLTDVAEQLEAAREAYRRRDWVTAREGFSAVRGQAALVANDLAALADCAWWLGALDEATQELEETYALYLEEERPRAASLTALELGYTLALGGDEAQGSGWMARAARLLEDEPECAERGYLVYIDFELALGEGDLATALEAARRVHELGTRFGDPNLVAMGVLGQGRAKLQQGLVGEGMALLDEAMVAAVSDELEPGWAGNIYCHLMIACFEIADLRRAGEWTQATSRWCATMPGAGPFMGICRVHRAELLAIQGAWDEAEREIVRVCGQMDAFDRPMVAQAHYQLGELRRQRGNLSGAEAAYRAAHRTGRDPQPGLSLLRLAQGRAESAAASIRSALAAADGQMLARANLLPAAVEIAIALDDIDGARNGSDELVETARIYATAGLQATSCQVEGAVLLAEDRPAAALPVLRRALRCWQDLHAPHETARVRLLLARVHDALGDTDTAALERDAARAELIRLGAPEHPGTPRPARRAPDGLTQREAQILRMVAAGGTNQQIAAELVLSVRTVERHLATIYTKLGLHGRNARAAAVSHALREGLLPTP